MFSNSPSINFYIASPSSSIPIAFITVVSGIVTNAETGTSLRKVSVTKCVAAAPKWTIPLAKTL